MVAPGASSKGPASVAHQADEPSWEPSRSPIPAPLLHRTSSTTGLSNGYGSDASSASGSLRRLQLTNNRSVYVSSAPFAASHVQRSPTPDLGRRQTVFRTDTMNRPMTQVTSGLVLTEHVPPGRGGSGHVAPRHWAPVHVVRVAKAQSNEQFMPNAPKHSRDVFCSGAPFAAGTSIRAAKPVQPGQTVFRVETTNSSTRARAGTPNSRSGAVYLGPPSARSSPMHPSGAMGFKGAKGAEIAGGASKATAGMRPKTSQGPYPPGTGQAKGSARLGPGHGSRASAVGMARPRTSSAMGPSKSWNDVIESAHAEELGPTLTMSKSHADVGKISGDDVAMGGPDMAEMEEFDDCLLEIDLSANSDSDRLAKAVLPPQLEAVHVKTATAVAGEGGQAVLSLKEAPSQAAGKGSDAKGDSGLKKVSSFPWFRSRESTCMPVKGGKSMLMEEEAPGESERPPSRGFNFRVFGVRQKTKA